MSAQTIYFKLVEAGMSPVGACAMLGNMQAESGMRANNAQDGYGYTDEGYTAKVDAGQLNFIDSIGYGLCQWTYGPRKLKLLQFARSRGVSVGDEDMQVDFCIQELRSEYPKLWLYLCDATGVYEAAEKICTEYERPAVNNVNARAGYANGFYMSFGGVEPSQSPTVTAGGELPQSGKGSHPGVPPEGEPSENESYWPPRMLALGMYGPDVVALQGLLIAHGYPAGVSGSFDSATAVQLMAFQAAKGLKADGIAGRKSWAALTKGV